jgi:hypothetical protein
VRSCAERAKPAQTDANPRDREGRPSTLGIDPIPSRAARETSEIGEIPPERIGAANQPRAPSEGSALRRAGIDSVSILRPPATVSALQREGLARAEDGQ